MKAKTVSGSDFLRDHRLAGDLQRRHPWRVGNIGTFHSTALHDDSVHPGHVKQC
jgi:hypothetical protein